jgi:hypothetical protein
LGKGSVKFFVGLGFGASFLGGMATGVFFCTPTARSVGRSAVTGAGTSARYVGRGTVRAARGVSRAAESGYTKVRGREAYLERQIDSLRSQITNLEKRVPDSGFPEYNGRA